VTEQIIAERYRLERLLGQSSMAEVWLAHDIELERPLAVKLLGPNADPVRFAREARAVASLAHPNVVQLYDYGESDGRRFMVLEYLPAKTLEDLLTDGESLPDERTAAIAAQIAAGLAHAHARGLVHRDLKPANVLFDDEGRAKISDFGIARMSGVDTITEEGTVLGTGAYLSPEQASGLPASPASDVYAFGVILFRMLTGSLPFEARTVAELAAKHRSEPPPAVRSLRRDPPPVLERVTQDALQKDPAARPPDGAALVSALGAATAGTRGRTPAEVADTVVLRRRGPRRVPLLPIAAALLLAALGVAAAVLLTRPGSKVPSAPARPIPHTTPTSSSTPPSTTASTSSASTSATSTTSTRQTTTTPPVSTPSLSTTTRTSTTITGTTTPPITTTGTTTGTLGSP
jgi:eukaryotic-like serine/threonine-protein kinase